MGLAVDAVFISMTEVSPRGLAPESLAIATPLAADGAHGAQKLIAVFVRVVARKSEA